MDFYSYHSGGSILREGVMVNEVDLRTLLVRNGLRYSYLVEGGEKRRKAGGGGEG